MQAALVAYRTLVELARADGHISDDERDLLERYRLALGLERDTEGLAELEPDPGPAPSRDIPPAQRDQVLRMLIRVAHADGVVAPRERERLRQVAARLGLDRVEAAELFVEIENEIRGGRGARRSMQRLVAALVVVAALAAAATVWIVRRGATAEDAARLGERIDRLALERAEHDAELVRRSAEDSIGLSAFKRIESRHAASVLLVVVYYELVRGDAASGFWSTGTGFFVTPDGLLVTNKHVAQPWKYSAEAALLIEDGFVLDEESLRMGAWPAGANLRTAEGDFDVTTGYYNRAGTLSLYRTTDDRIERRPTQLDDGRVLVAAVHAMGPGDLAVLQAVVTEPVVPLLPPADSPGVEKLDPVMVLGYPRGLGLLEHDRAELSVALGEVSKIEDSIMITAPVVPGNSGGPVVDRRGHVVGVATLTPGQGLGICLRSDGMLELLPEAGELIDRARRSAEAGREGAALALLDLAERRGPAPDERARIAELRSALGDL